MNRKAKSKAKVTKTSTESMKSRRDDSLEEIRDCLRLLVAFQKNAVAQAELTKKREKHDQDRLVLYDRFIPLIVNCFEELESALAEKQPGGRPPNSLREMAFDTLTDRYIEQGDVPKAKILIKIMKETLPEGSLDSDEYGKEPFSTRQAQEIVRFFNNCLRYTSDDEN
jgi:hypothetical protein